MVDVPTGMVQFYGKFVYIYTNISPMDYMG